MSMLESLTGESRKFKFCLLLYLGTVFLLVGGWVSSSTYENTTMTLAATFVAGNVGEWWTKKGNPQAPAHD